MLLTFVKNADFDLGMQYFPRLKRLYYREVKMYAYEQFPNKRPGRRRRTL